MTENKVKDKRSHIVHQWRVTPAGLMTTRAKCGARPIRSGAQVDMAGGPLWRPILPPRSRWCQRCVR